jgi:hypothetical protein
MYMQFKTLFLVVSFMASLWSTWTSILTLEVLSNWFGFSLNFSCIYFQWKSSIPLLFGGKLRFLHSYLPSTIKSENSFIIKSSAAFRNPREPVFCNYLSRLPKKFAMDLIAANICHLKNSDKLFVTNSLIFLSLPNPYRTDFLVVVSVFLLIYCIYPLDKYPHVLCIATFYQHYEFFSFTKLGKILVSVPWFHMSSYHRSAAFSSPAPEWQWY